MDFDEIYDRWEKKGSKKNKASKGDWLNAYPPPENTKNEYSEYPTDLGNERRRLRTMKPQATLDLHGYTTNEAKQLIDQFLKDSVGWGLQKVLIIHGKGNHSDNGSVLPRFVADYLSTHPLAGENKLSDRNQGGSGARWVILRQRSR